VSKRTKQTLPPAAERAWARPLKKSDFDWEKPAVRELPPAAIAVLIYMLRIEGATSYYLRLMKTAVAKKDWVITNYLVNWIQEETVHAELLREYLRIRGYKLDDDVLSWQKRLRLSINVFVMHAASRLIGRHSITVHMTWGFINELTTKISYERMIELHGKDDPLLADILGKIAKQEGGHMARNLREARDRLDDSLIGRFITCWTLVTFWSLVGQGYRPKEEGQAVIRYLLPREDGYAEAKAKFVDDAIDELAGLKRLRLMQHEVKDAYAAENALAA